LFISRISEITELKLFAWWFWHVCLCDTEVSEILGFLERFLRQKVMNREFDGSEKPLRDSYKWLRKKALALFRSHLKNLCSSMF